MEKFVSVWLLLGLRLFPSHDRNAVVEYLLSVDSCICNDIVEEVKLAQPTVSQHLKELKNAGIIQGEIDGKAICYCINPDTLKKMEHFISEIFRNRKMTSWFQNSLNFCKCFWFVRHQIHHAIAYHNIGNIAHQRNILNVSQTEFYIIET